MKKSTASANIHTLEHFFIPQLQRHRTIRIYLPTNYFKSLDRYPVIYMQDGQNLFDQATAFHREWKVDKTINKLTKGKRQKCIVVGIDNGGENRSNEYAPFKNSRLGGGEGDAYLSFIVETLKPYIDSHFRTQPQRETTAIAGSSMGGLISFYAGVRFPHIFGKIGAFSPSFWFNPQVCQLAKQSHYYPTYWYVAGSQTESRYMRKNLEDVYWALKQSGYTDAELQIIVRDRGKHNEIFWGREFPKLYQWWF